MAETETQTLTWPDRFETLTHLLTHQTLSPSLHSQLFVSLRIPNSLPNPSSYPPLLSPTLSLLSFSLSLSLSRLSPSLSWRSLCPFQQPPPATLAAGVAPAPDRLGPEERREYAMRRIRRRKRRGSDVAELLFLIVPNLAALSLVVRSDGFWRQKKLL